MSYLFVGNSRPVWSYSTKKPIISSGCNKIWIGDGNAMCTLPSVLVNRKVYYEVKFSDGEVISKIV